MIHISTNRVGEIDRSDMEGVDVWEDEVYALVAEWIKEMYWMGEEEEEFRVFEYVNIVVYKRGKVEKMEMQNHVYSWLERVNVYTLRGHV